jgi:hypothetical protein
MRAEGPLNHCGSSSLQHMSGTSPVPQLFTVPQSHREVTKSQVSVRVFVSNRDNNLTLMNEGLTLCVTRSVEGRYFPKSISY